MSARNESVRVPSRTVFEIATSVVRCPGPRHSGLTRGTLPNVNAGAASNAAGLIHPDTPRSSWLPVVITGTPGTRFGRCPLPSRPELLLACPILIGNPVWYRPATVTCHPPSTDPATPPPLSHRRPSPNGSWNVALKFSRCLMSSSDGPYSASRS